MNIFVVIPSYADKDIANTLESAIRMSSGRNQLRFSVCEQRTAYVESYRVGRRFPDHVELRVTLVGERLVGVGGARRLAEEWYSGEEYQVQLDAHVRFDTDWDERVVRLLERLGDHAVVSGLNHSDPWRDAGKIPVVRFDHFIDDGCTPFGHVEMVEPESGRLDEAQPARTIIAGALAGAAWCDEVPSDPHIVFTGDEPTMAARLWTHGRDLFHARMPWVQSTPGLERPPNRPWELPEWAARNECSLRRVRALLVGYPLPADDPAAEDVNLYALGHARTLDDWVEYSGLDYRNGVIQPEWP